MLLGHHNWLSASNFPQEDTVSNSGLQGLYRQAIRFTYYLNRKIRDPRKISFCQRSLRLYVADSRFHLDPREEQAPLTLATITVEDLIGATAIIQQRVAKVIICRIIFLISYINAFYS